MYFANVKKMNKQWFTKYFSAVVFVLLLLFNVIFTKNFVSAATFSNIITQATKIVLLSLGMTLVVATGGIDISVGSGMALGATIAALFLSAGQPLGILVSFVVVVLFGMLAGTLVSKFNVLPMVVTLALQYVMRGLSKGISGRGTISYSAPSLTKIFISPIGGIIPIHFFIIVLAVLAMYIVVNHMKFGAHVEAYGNNPLAASISGINTVKVVLICYVIAAIFAWASGMIDMFMVSSADPSKIGLDLETDAIAAALIGGTPVTGGHPNIIGTVFGAFLLQLVTMMCNMHNVPYPYSLMIKAGIIVFSLVFQILQKRNNR